MEAPPTIDNNAQFVSQFANNSVLDLVKVLTGAIFHGIYLVLLLAALSILGRREGKAKAKIILILALLVMFAMSAFQFWAIVHVCFQSIQIVLVNNTDMTYAAKSLVFIEKFILFAAVVQVMLPLEIVIGDAIVLWRVWKLCMENRRLVYLPMLLLSATTGKKIFPLLVATQPYATPLVCSLAFFGCIAKNDWPVINPDTCNKLQISAFSLSMATNLTGTLVVGYKVWCVEHLTVHHSLLAQGVTMVVTNMILALRAYRKAVREFLGQCCQRTRAEKVLVLFLESGLVYSILWIIQLVVILLPPARTFPGQVVQQVFNTTSIQMVGIYPTLLVVLIYLQYSMWDSTGTFSTNAAIPTSNSVTVYDTSGGSKTTLGSSKMA
ncbi:hypothetical protein PQX77_002105 [Marasmius sp. AFHP31]|nr:hypothetical protein PQX77_002105 [Marasmius sp. AFHP31]